MTSREKQIRFVGKLLKLTMIGELVWRPVSETEFDEESDVIYYNRFAAAVADMDFFIYQKRNRYSRVQRKFGDVLPRENRQLQTILEIHAKHRDIASEVIVDIDDMPIVGDLYAVIKKTVPSVSANMDAFLAEEVTHAH